MAEHEGIRLQYVILKDVGEKLGVFFVDTKPILLNMESKSKPGTANPYALFKVVLAHDGQTKYLALHQKYDSGFITLIEQYAPNKNTVVEFSAELAKDKEGNQIFSKKDGTKVVRTVMHVLDGAQTPPPAEIKSKPAQANSNADTSNDLYQARVGAGWAIGLLYSDAKLRGLFAGQLVDNPKATEDREQIMKKAELLLALHGELVERRMKPVEKEPAFMPIFMPPQKEEIDPTQIPF